jgi:rod shape-determining protein MreD
MTHLLLALITYAAFVAQSSLATEIRIAGASPDFLLLVIVVALVKLDDWKALAWAALAGLLIDTLATDHLGIGLVVATLTALVVQLVCRRESEWSLWSIIALSFVVVFTSSLVLSSIRICLASVPVDTGHHFLVVLGQSAYSATVIAVLSLFCRTIATVRLTRLAKTATASSRGWPA